MRYWEEDHHHEGGEALAQAAQRSCGCPPRQGPRPGWMEL